MQSLVHSGHFGGPQTTSFIITLAVIVLVLVLRNRRARSLKIERMWVRPVLFLAILTSTMAAAPPPLDPLSVVVLAAALILGCALGWQRGRLMRITVDPATHALTSQASAAGIVFILALVLIRFGLRNALATGSIGGLRAVTAADAFIVLGAGTMATQSLEMWLRARRLLADAVAARAAAGGVAPLVK